MAAITKTSRAARESISIPADGTPFAIFGAGKGPLRKLYTVSVPGLSKGLDTDYLTPISAEDAFNSGLPGLSSAPLIQVAEFLAVNNMKGACAALTSKSIPYTDKRYEAFLGLGIEEAPEDVAPTRSEEHTSELQSRQYLVCRLLLEK